MMHKYIAAFEAAKSNAKHLQFLSQKQVQETLEILCDLIEDHMSEIISANELDLIQMDTLDPKYDRLKLTKTRIENIVSEIRQVSALPSPLGKKLESKELENGLTLEKITVPLGVIGIIYEARPNVTFDVFVLALKSGNGLILKGGKDANLTNQAIMKVIYLALVANNIPVEAFHLLSPERLSTKALLEAVGYVDLVIPRGSQVLIDYVRQHAKVPVIETGAGIVHIYVDADANLGMARNILLNAKTRRPSVCNSLDCLIIHKDQLPQLKAIVRPLIGAEVEIFADTISYEVLQDEPNVHLANDKHFGTEFLSLKIAIKTVNSMEEAFAHIEQHSSKHSEAIVSENESNVELFLKTVDAAAVYANASTAFTDGNQFGLGAEIGISTQKLHARGPMGLAELTSYKWVIRGNGQTRD